MLAIPYMNVFSLGNGINRIIVLVGWPFTKYQYNNFMSGDLTFAGSDWATWTRDLDPTFRDNYLSDPELHRQAFIASTGMKRTYSGRCSHVIKPILMHTVVFCWKLSVLQPNLTAVRWPVRDGTTTTPWCLYKTKNRRLLQGYHVCVVSAYKLFVDKNNNPRLIDLFRGIHRWPVDSPYKGYNTEKCPCHDGIDELV